LILKQFSHGHGQKTDDSGLLRYGVRDEQT